MSVSFPFACLRCLIHGSQGGGDGRCAYLGHTLACCRTSLLRLTQEVWWDCVLCSESFAGEPAVWLADNLGLHLSVSGPPADLISKTGAPTFLQEGGAQNLVWGDSKGTELGWPAPLLLPRGTDTSLSSAVWASLSSWSTSSSWLMRRDKWFPHTQGAHFQLLHPSCQHTFFCHYVHSTVI